MKLAVLLTLAALTAFVLAADSAAYDRPPVSIQGLTPDGWGQSTTKAEKQLRDRYPGISADYCLGIKIPDWPASSSSWVTGYTRYWDKLLCFGRTYDRSVFGLVLDAKGKYSWVIYRLKGASLSDLTG